MPTDYEQFIARKADRARPVGLRKIPRLPVALKPFQHDIVTWALRLGRGAVFAGTGLGKTLMQLSWADAVAKHTKGAVLILTPLAVAQQTVGEARKFGIEGVAYAADQGEASSRIVVTNYDRVEKFDPRQFTAVVLDESSIIKSHNGKTRATLMEMFADTPFRLCCTATPAPNDYVELGNHAEFLGICSAKEMLSMWFVHDGAIRATGMRNHGAKPTADWRLKGHAEKAFWAWVATWSVVIRHPRDLGYDEPGYDLPPLVKHQIVVATDHDQAATGAILPMNAQTLSERRAAARNSIAARVDAAVGIIAANPGQPWLVWCNLNDEADALRAAVPDIVEVRGLDDPEVKAQRLLGFADGNIDRLLTKPRIAGFGLNWQRCHAMIFLGLNDSFEQVYQAIRRCWRFGQSRQVDVYMIAADIEGAVVANQNAKERAAEHMAAQMAEHMRDLTANALRGAARVSINAHETKMKLPVWLMQ